MNKYDRSLKKFLATNKPNAGRTIVIGNKVYPKGGGDRRALYQDAVGLDISDGEGVDIVHDLERQLPRRYGLFDHVDCRSVLEHVKRPWLMAQNIQLMMNAGATLFVSVPTFWRLHAYPDDYFRFTAQALEVLFPNVDWVDLRYLSEDGFNLKPRHLTDEGMRYFARTEVVGFGIMQS